MGSSDLSDPGPKTGPFAMLRRMARANVSVDTCEFCSEPLPSVHRHLLEVPTRKIVCVCMPCGLRFESGMGKWKLIPRDTIALPRLQLSDLEWEIFALPINLAFFFHSTRAGKVVAMFPSPAGAVESLVPVTTWQALVAANPFLGRMQPDVEALLINRVGTARDYFLTPIDVCFELVGVIRLHWRGFSGGDRVWQEIENYFSELRAQSVRTIAREGEAVHA